MAEDVEIVETPAAKRRWHMRLLRGIGLAIGGLIALFLVALWTIDTQPGHRLIADHIGKMRPSSGLRIKIGRIEGSIWRRATLRDVRLYDLRGQFFEAPEIRLDWHPFAWAHNKLDITSVSAPLLILDRLPKLKSKPGGPILPGFDIHIGALRVDRLKLGKAVAGHAEMVRLAAKADIHGRRAMIQARASSTAGDRVMIDLDAEPDGDKFKLNALVDGPANGVVTGLAGFIRRCPCASAGAAPGMHGTAACRARLAARRSPTLASACATVRTAWGARLPRRICCRANCSG